MNSLKSALLSEKIKRLKFDLNKGKSKQDRFGRKKMSWKNYYSQENRLPSLWDRGAVVTVKGQEMKQRNLHQMRVSPITHSSSLPLTLSTSARLSLSPLKQYNHCLTWWIVPNLRIVSLRPLLCLSWALKLRYGWVRYTSVVSFNPLRVWCKEYIRCSSLLRFWVQRIDNREQQMSESSQCVERCTSAEEEKKRHCTLGQYIK